MAETQNRIEHQIDDDPTERPGALQGSPFSLDFRVALTAVVTPEPGGGYSAEVPALPGCFTEGETIEEVKRNLRDAAGGWLKAKEDLARQETANNPHTGEELFMWVLAREERYGGGLMEYLTQWAKSSELPDDPNQWTPAQVDMAHMEVYREFLRARHEERSEHFTALQELRQGGHFSPQAGRKTS